LLKVNIYKTIHKRFSGKQETGYETLILCVWVWRLLTLVEKNHRVCVSVCACLLILLIRADNCDQ